MSSALQVATVPTINWAQCKKKYGNLKPGVTERMICASSLNGDKNVCQVNFLFDFSETNEI